MLREKAKDYIMEQITETLQCEKEPFQMREKYQLTSWIKRYISEREVIVLPTFDSVGDKSHLQDSLDSRGSPIPRKGMDYVMGEWLTHLFYCLFKNF